MKKLFLFFILLFVATNLAFADTASAENPITVESDLSFTLPDATYNTLLGDISLWADFKFFGEQSGKFLWELENFGTTTSAGNPITIESDLSFSFDATYNTLLGDLDLTVNFIFFGDQDGKLLWELDSYTASSDSTCGAYVAPGVWKEFDCYNLAAIGKTTSDDPFTPSWRLNGGYWQWGRKGPDESQWYDTNTENFAHGPTGPDSGDANDGTISSWDDDYYAPDGSWSDSYKTSNDPCPAGYRVPTESQWDGVDDNNTQTTVGTWSSSWDDYTNYRSARFFGNDLMLPAAGYRYYYSGALYNRGYYGYYWGSSENDSYDAWALTFSSGNVGTYNYCRRDGFSVRCVAE